MDKSISMRFFIIMICITAFFYNAIGNGYFMLILCLVPVCLKIIRMLTRIRLNSSAMLMVFIAFAFLSATFSLLQSVSNRFLFIMIMFFVIKLVLEDNFGWQKFFSTLLFLITVLSIAATFLSVIAPNVMLNVAKMFFSGEALDTYILLFDGGSYAGLYGQTGINAYVISIFLAFIVTSLFSENRAKLNYALLAIGIIALFLTKKRSFLLANIIATLVIFMQNSKSDKNKMKKVSRLLFLVIAAFLVVRYAPATQGLIEKMMTLENAGDITNGRIVSWEDTIEMWKQSPMFGIGTNVMNKGYGISTHNVYIQLLAEMGIFGAISYVLLLWTSFRRSEKIYQDILKDETLINGEKSIYGVSIYMQVIFIVYSFFGNPVYGINFMLPYIVFVGVMDSYQKYRREMSK